MIISIVGIGYGQDMTGTVAQALHDADVVIGHKDFLAAVRDLVRDEADCYDVRPGVGEVDDIFALRAQAAIDHAATGARVVIVSGGDPGLLGMAGPLLRRLHAQRSAGKLPEVRVLPGLSAWQYASARLGAPFNGGVCVLSLCLHSHSDEKIARQVGGVAASGLGVVAYMLRHNGEISPERYPTAEPAVELSRRRFLLLRDTLLRHRDPDTPTFLVSRIGEPDEAVVRAPLHKSFDLWTQSGPESVFCVPGADYESTADFVWSIT